MELKLKMLVSEVIQYNGQLRINTGVKEKKKQCCQGA
jgi:hypothetical protein